ncbi:hypothetical protein JOE61_002324 [Nocardioides salarius]|uniref:DUF3322 and DUF2220 domain-containing protein n=1 Tax=Nocardioides salarius TaxID=374513 RepID=A0ABS2MBE1_9ACTN|nr:DUF3322 and DUF2220 domain-containing protein [Nocardioides salarius]MBM7508510.1 hypothetical protein [Nocardioides salarius]
MSTKSTSKSRVAERFTAAAVTDAVRSSLTNHWATHAVSGTAWPREVSLGRHGSADVETQWDEVFPAILTLRSWAREQGLVLRGEAQRILRTSQEIPRAVLIPSVEDAARLAGAPWPAQVDRAAARAAALREALARRTDLEDDEAQTTATRLLKKVIDWPDVDFDLLLRVAAWITANPQVAVGLTRRQVPIPGVHGKWLESNETRLLELTGLTTLGLTPSHPPRIHFNYLDAAYLADPGNRRHDSLTHRDSARPAYQPQVIIICENKDSAINFHPVPGGIAVEGDGTGGGTIAAIDWIRNAPTLIYWGDMDAAGLEILSGFRACGLEVNSVLMDVATYETYREFGTNMQPNGTPIKALGPKPDRLLTAPERDLYERVADPTYTGVRRVEQERIPLAVARAAVQQMLDRTA